MPKASHPFTALLQKRVVVLDGAMGTTLQRLGLSEADYRGERFRNWKGKDLKGAIELLLLTKPEAVEHVHEDYLRAGADVIETNTFSATTIADFATLHSIKLNRVIGIKSTPCWQAGWTCYSLKRSLTP